MGTWDKVNRSLARHEQAPRPFAEIDKAETPAWDHLPEDKRSGSKGWSKGGDFFCPHCSTIIGHNLRGEGPEPYATRHMAEKHPDTKKAEPKGKAASNPYRDSSQDLLSFDLRTEDPESPGAEKLRDDPQTGGKLRAKALKVAPHQAEDLIGHLDAASHHKHAADDAMDSDDEANENKHQNMSSRHLRAYEKKFKQYTGVRHSGNWDGHSDAIDDVYSSGKGPKAGVMHPYDASLKREGRGARGRQRQAI